MPPLTRLAKINPTTAARVVEIAEPMNSMSEVDGGNGAIAGLHHLGSDGVDLFVEIVPAARRHVQGAASPVNPGPHCESSSSNILFETRAHRSSRALDARASAALSEGVLVSSMIPLISFHAASTSRPISVSFKSYSCLRPDTWELGGSCIFAITMRRNARARSTTQVDHVDSCRNVACRQFVKQMAHPPDHQHRQDGCRDHQDDRSDSNDPPSDRLPDAENLLKLCSLKVLGMISSNGVHCLVRTVL